MALDRVADEVRQGVHRGDIVLAIEPSWVVVLGLAEPTGFTAIVKRLRGKLRESGQMRFGIAMHPADGDTAVALFARASRTLEQGLASATVSQAS